MIENNTAIGQSWEDVEDEFLTAEEKEECEQSVILLGDLIAAKEKGLLTEKEYLLALETILHPAMALYNSAV